MARNTGDDTEIHVRTWTYLFDLFKLFMGLLPKPTIHSLNKFFQFLRILKHIKAIFIYHTALGNLTRNYVESIQNGAIPCIQNAVKSTAYYENEKAMGESRTEYR